MSNKDLQTEIDIKKWLDSEACRHDTCGSYEFCPYCNKDEETPCANAVERLRSEGVDTEITGVITEEDICNKKKSLGKNFNYDKVMAKKAARKSLTFAEKFALSDKVVKQRYAILKSALTDACGEKASQIKNRVSKQCDTYRCNGETIAKITIIGTSLRLNLPFDCDAECFNDGKTPHTFTGHKRVYEAVPFQFKVNSKLALKRALSLIEMLKADVIK
jgi:hypothetical protein